MDGGLHLHITLLFNSFPRERKISQKISQLISVAVMGQTSFQPSSSAELSNFSELEKNVTRCVIK